MTMGYRIRLAHRAGCMGVLPRNCHAEFVSKCLEIKHSTQRSSKHLLVQLAQFRALVAILLPLSSEKNVCHRAVSARTVSTTKWLLCGTLAELPAQDVLSDTGKVIVLPRRHSTSPPTAETTAGSSALS